MLVELVRHDLEHLFADLVSRLIRGLQCCQKLRVALPEHVAEDKGRCVVEFVESAHGCRCALEFFGHVVTTSPLSLSETTASFPVYR